MTAHVSDLDVRAHVERVVAAAARCRPPLAGHTRLVEDLGLSSLAVVELFVRLEDELHTELDEDMVAAGQVTTVADVIAALRSGHG